MFETSSAHRPRFTDTAGGGLEVVPLADVVLVVEPPLVPSPPPVHLRSQKLSSILPLLRMALGLFRPVPSVLAFFRPLPVTLFPLGWVFLLRLVPLIVLARLPPISPLSEPLGFQTRHLLKLCVSARARHLLRLCVGVLITWLRQKNLVQLQWAPLHLAHACSKWILHSNRVIMSNRQSQQAIACKWHLVRLLLGTKY